MLRASTEQNKGGLGIKAMQEWSIVPTCALHRSATSREEATCASSACALMSLAVLVCGGFHQVTPAAQLLAGIVILIVIARMVVAVRENVGLLEASQRDALTDSLTGLGNRRSLHAALERTLAAGTASAPAVLVSFDLDGFKRYNDRYGHVAGDAMLSQLGQRLQSAVADRDCLPARGRRALRAAQRVPSTIDSGSIDSVVQATVTALSAGGDGFPVSASHGRVALPHEARTLSDALRIADSRLYVCKGQRRGSVRQQTHDVLLEVLREREPRLHEHMREVGRLAVLVGRPSVSPSRNSMSSGRLPSSTTSARRRSRTRSNKPGPLVECEWELIRRHTIVGERILCGAPALARLAVVVRSSHERWDGHGYPDRIAGSAIPRGARIVFVCDAFDAMTSERPYAGPLAPTRALAELMRGAGTQFDPEVVSAFALTWEAGEGGEIGRARAAA